MELLFRLADSSTFSNATEKVAVLTISSPDLTLKQRQFYEPFTCLRIKINFRSYIDLTNTL